MTRETYEPQIKDVMLKLAKATFQNGTIDDTAMHIYRNHERGDVVVQIDYRKANNWIGTSAQDSARQLAMSLSGTHYPTQSEQHTIDWNGLNSIQPTLTIHIPDSVDSIAKLNKILKDIVFEKATDYLSKPLAKATKLIDDLLPGKPGKEVKAEVERWVADSLGIARTR